MRSYFITCHREPGYDALMQQVRSRSLTYSVIPKTFGWAKIELVCSERELEMIKSMDENFQIPGGLKIDFDESGLI